ncbi:hypothetical protein N2152v2_006541 [Parachlorella kessleri]
MTHALSEDGNDILDLLFTGDEEQHQLDGSLGKVDWSQGARPRTEALTTSCHTPAAADPLGPLVEVTARPTLAGPAVATSKSGSSGQPVETSSPPPTYQVDSELLGSLPTDLAQDLGSFHSSVELIRQPEPAATPATAPTSDLVTQEAAPHEVKFVAGAESSRPVVSAATNFAASLAAMEAPALPATSAVQEYNAVGPAPRPIVSPASKARSLERHLSLGHQVAEVLGTLAVTSHSLSRSSSGGSRGSWVEQESSDPRFDLPGPASPLLTTITEQSGEVVASLCTTDCGGADKSMDALDNGDHASSEDDLAAVIRLLMGGQPDGEQKASNALGKQEVSHTPVSWEREKIPARKASSISAKSHGEGTGPAKLSPAKPAPKPASRRGSSEGESDSENVRACALMYVRYAEMRQQEEAAGLEDCTFTPRINPRSRELLRNGISYPQRPLTILSARSTSPPRQHGPTTKPSPGSCSRQCSPSPTRLAADRAPSPQRLPPRTLSGADACREQLQYSGLIADHTAAALGIPVGFPALQSQLAGASGVGGSGGDAGSPFGPRNSSLLFRSRTTGHSLRPASAGSVAHPDAAYDNQGDDNEDLYRALSFGSNWADEILEAGAAAAGITSAALGQPVQGPAVSKGTKTALATGKGSALAAAARQMAGPNGEVGALHNTQGSGCEQGARPLRRANSANSNRIMSPWPQSPSERAGQRLYAHAVDMQRRQKDSVRQFVQKEFRETYGAGPRARPLPGFYNGHGTYVSLQKRPKSASASSKVAVAVAAERAEWFRPKSATHQGNDDDAYWRQHKLPAGSDFDAFLERQERFVKDLEEGLEKERALLPSQPALAPGTRRIIEQKVKEQQCDGGLGDVMPLATRGPGSVEGGPVGGGSCAATSALHSVLQAMGLAEQGETRESKQAAIQDERGYKFHPKISLRAKAKPARSPAEMHAAWAAHQEKLAAKQQAEEQARLAECTFHPTILPTSKYAGIKPKVQMKEIAAYLAEEQDRLKAREESHIKAMLAREEQELAVCTFSPSTTPYKFDLQRPIPAVTKHLAAIQHAQQQAHRPATAALSYCSPHILAKPATADGSIRGSQVTQHQDDHPNGQHAGDAHAAIMVRDAATLAGTAPKAGSDAAPALASPRPPSKHKSPRNKLASAAEAAAAVTAAAKTASSLAASRHLERNYTNRALQRQATKAESLAVNPTNPLAGQVPTSFDSYLDRVLTELQQMQTGDGVPAVWGTGAGAASGWGEGGVALGLPVQPSPNH